MPETLNIAIIGGGAAGFFAAIAAKQTNKDAQVTIFERAPRVLAKVEVTGGGRCNLTNSFEGITDLSRAYPRGGKLMARLFHAFNHEDTMNWFRKRGVPLVVQQDRCVFPASQSSLSVINALTKEAQRLGITVLVRKQLTALAPQDDGSWLLRFADSTERRAHRVLLATGGSPRKSHLAYLERLQHRVEEPVPSLFTFNISDRRFTQLMGTVVNNVRVMMPGTKFSAQGPLLVTHWGMSGPAILKLSSYAARALQEADYRMPIAVCWVGESSRTEVENALKGIMESNPKKQLMTLRPFGITAKLWAYLLEKTGLKPEKTWAEVGKKDFNKLAETLVHDVYSIAGKGSYKEEFVTCGGISLKNINPNTLESKRAPGLFFAGELLDVDAITGGFNLQAAWTMGYVAGCNMAKPL